MGLRMGEDGKAVATSSVATGQSTSIDNSFRNDSGQTMGTETSAIQQLERPQAVHQLMTASEQKQPGSSTLTVATEAARALKPLYDQQYVDASTNSTVGSVGISTPGVAKLFGLSASATANIEQSYAKSGAVDLNTALFQHKLNDYRQEAETSADALSLTGAKREQYITDTVAPQAATLFKTVKEGYAEHLSNQADRSTGNDIRTPAPSQDEQQHTPQPRDNMFSANGAGSPQEYMAMQRQQHHQPAPRDKPAGLDGSPTGSVNKDDDSASSSHPPVNLENSQQGIPVEADSGTKQGNIPR